MAVLLTADVKQTLYPRAAVGPLGEIGFWSVTESLLGDASAGESVIAMSFQDVTNKMGFSISYVTFSTSSTAAEIAELVLAYRGPNNESFLWHLATGGIVGPGTSGMIPSNTLFRDRTVFYPVTLRSPTVLFLEPNMTLRTGNVDTVSNSLRAYGYLWPHMMLQPQPSSKPVVTIRT